VVLAGGTDVRTTLGAGVGGGGATTVQVVEAVLEPPAPLATTTKMCDPILKPVKSATPPSQLTLTPSSVQVVVSTSPVSAKSTSADVLVELAGGVEVRVTLGAGGGGASTCQLVETVLAPPTPLTTTTNVCDPTLKPVKSALPPSQLTLMPSSVQVVVSTSPSTTKPTSPTVLVELARGALLIATVGACGVGASVFALTDVPPALKAMSPKQ
jgi:hypothetical protein